MALRFAEPITQTSPEPTDAERYFVLPTKLAVALAALAAAAGTTPRAELITAVELHLDQTRGVDFEEL